MSPFVSPTAPLPGATMVVIPPNITGPTLLGILFNWGLMGVLAVQLYLFYENSRDRPAIKTLVYALAVLDIMQTVMVTADAFHWFVYGFGNPIQLDEPFFNSWDVPVLDSVISLIVQAFYCWRIYFLRKGVVIPVLILIVSVTQFSAGILTGVRNYQIGHLSLSHEYIVAETIWLAGGAVADLAIAGVLSWILLSARTYSSRPQYNSMLSVTIISAKRLQFPRSRDRSVTLSRLIRLIVETNALTAGVAVVAIALFWGFPGTALVSVPIAIIGKLYTNCLLALFNNRKRETAKSMDDDDLVSLRVSPNSALQWTSDSHLYQPQGACRELDGHVV
ncbi:hypothetical protein C8F04DRAFT_1274277 [Mycena alexandri]|uniref:DUF6534 domain-containing protein n=1 Tax=Mycena alexandri TaxID=1745969 RepID=A0AAD6S506_9AGAR|nr:hypothetical protein C8F04DRAFT_1274277 [Mycena alexandri]